MTDKTESPSAGAKPRCSGGCGELARWKTTLKEDFARFEAGETIYAASFKMPGKKRVVPCFGPVGAKWTLINRGA